jgi:hypothetical protein
MTTVGIDASLEHETLRTVSRRLIPFLFVLYVVSFLDRVNVGFDALEMNRDLNLSPVVYGWNRPREFDREPERIRGAYAIGLLNDASGNFHTGLLLLACVPLVGMALALRLRHASILRDAI